MKKYLRNIICLLSCVLFLHFSLRGQEFKVSYHDFRCDTVLASVALWRSDFYCLRDDGRILVIAGDSFDSKPLPTATRFNSLLVSNDSLLAFANNDSMYHFTGTGFRYIGKGKTRPFYEDENYTVTRTCSGEWGGSIYFTDKRSGRIYETEATCPVSVNRIEGQYWVSASLAHMSGSTEIFTVDDPTQLLLYNRNKLKKKKRIYVGEGESHSKKGTTSLIDSVGIFTVASFPLDGRLLHIVTDFEKTYLCSLANKSFELIQLISDQPLWSYRLDNKILPDGSVLIVFGHWKTTGFIHIRNKKINIWRSMNKSQ